MPAGRTGAVTGFRHFSAFAVCFAFGLAFAEALGPGGCVRGAVFALAFGRPAGLFFVSGVPSEVV